MNSSFDAFVVFTNTFPETISLFYNASQAARKASQESDQLSSKGKLMHDFACTNADQMYYNRLAERTRYFKESKEGEPTMNEVLEKFKTQVERKARQEGKSEGIAIGKAEGLELGLDNTLKAIGLIQAGKYALEEIASLSGLSVENVKAIQAEISATV